MRIEEALWDTYAAARIRHDLMPSPESEAAAIATYAEWAREAHPAEADELITLCCHFIAQRDEAA